MRLPLLLAVLLSAAALAAPEDFSKPQVVRLKSNKRVAGYVLQSECTNEKLVIRDMRSKARREIAWADIKPDEAHELRVKLGFEVEEKKGGLMITGVEIVTKAGAKFVGLLTNAKTAQADGMYILKRADGQRRIRVADVRSGPTEVQVSALEIYTPLELYEQRLKEKPPVTAEDHFQLAEFAALMGALEPAKMHYEKVLAMGEKKYPEALIKRRLERIAKRLGNREAEEAIRTIKANIWRKQFVKASKNLAEFAEKYKEDEELAKEAERLKADLTERRQTHYVTLIPGKLRKEIKDLFAKKVKEAELTLRMATNYAGGESSDDKSATHEALKNLGAELGIEPEEVLDFWKLRSKRATQKAFYRDGTFIVVDNLQDALSKAPKIPQGKGSTVKPPKPHPIRTPDGWWNGKLKARKYSQARDWLYAWWAEKSGMVELLDPKSEPCGTCAGKGYISQSFSSSQGTVPYFDRCQSCYMAKHFRVVRFK